MTLLCEFFIVLMKMIFTKRRADPDIEAALRFICEPSHKSEHKLNIICFSNCSIKFFNKAKSLFASFS